ncbi:hypothetical protein PVK06_011322 [Gossypium arboreum]|uniref:Very-long-chain aldehyde decarbonylase CER1-like C-terminal domain-containing protein n=1 Tax=Gossypium arboreum TaxID=29729 RepID=A0ABR0Q9R4_GOSAR|nr:hypothetical protein PVK06_011322 [Gossypium arboreum]
MVGVYIQKHPQLKVKLVDGSSLAVTVVLNRIPKGTTQVVLRGKLTKVACALAFALCQKRIQVFVLHEDEYEKLDKLLGTKSEGKLVLSKSYTCKIITSQRQIPRPFVSWIRQPLTQKANEPTVQSSQNVQNGRSLHKLKRHGRKR